MNNSFKEREERTREEKERRETGGEEEEKRQEKRMKRKMMSPTKEAVELGECPHEGVLCPIFLAEQVADLQRLINLGCNTGKRL